MSDSSVMVFGTGDDAVVFEPVEDAGMTGFTSKAAWRWASKEPVKGAPRREFHGRDTFTVGLSGAVYPGQVGDVRCLIKLGKLGDSGEPHPLTDGTGHTYGMYTLKDIPVTREHWVGGVPRKITFTLTLERWTDE